MFGDGLDINDEGMLFMKKKVEGFGAVVGVYSINIVEEKASVMFLFVRGHDVALPIVMLRL